MGALRPFPAICRLNQSNAARALLLWFDLAPSRTASRPWAGIGPAVMVPGDYHGVVVFATPPASETDFRVSLKYVGPVTDQMLALGPPITAPTASRNSV